MAPKLGYMQRFEVYRPSKSMLGWSCAICVVATMIVGFAWGGWVTGSTADAMAAKAAQGANAQLAATLCAAQFNHGADAAVQLAALTKLDSWQRADFIKKGGWDALPGVKDPVSGAAELCAKQLTGPTL